MNQKVTETEISEALVTYSGNFATAADALGVTRDAIAKRVAKSRKLQLVASNAKERRIDKAESVIDRCLDRDDMVGLMAAKYILGTIGKDRGYTEKQETAASDGFTVIIEGEYAGL